MENTELSVQVSTKLNHSHAVTGAEALILPTLGRTEIDRQESGPQFVSVEDTVCAVHASHGTVEPVAPGLLSEVAIVSRLAQRVLGDRIGADWAGFEKDYDLIRDHISHVVVGCEDYNRKIRQEGGFVLPNGPRDSRTFNTPTGKAMLTVNQLEHVERPAGHADPADHPLARPVQHHHLRPQRPVPRHQEGPGSGVREPGGPHRTGA
jgi:hypothetical protein